MIFSEKGARKISAPSRLTMSVEYQDLSSGEMVTDLTAFRKSGRSISDTALPLIYRRQKGGKTPELAVNLKPDGLALPTIGELNVNNKGRPRRLSATNLGCRSMTPSPGVLAVPASANISQSRSAQSSPCGPRRAYSVRVLSPSCRRKYSIGDFGEERSLQLDKVLKQKVPNQEVAMANIRVNEHMCNLESQEQMKQNTEKVSVSRDGIDVLKTRKISSPGTKLHLSTRKAGIREGQKSLEESMDDLRFCKYLRMPSMEEDFKGAPPDKLVPKVIITDHSEWVPGD